MTHSRENQCVKRDEGQEMIECFRAEIRRKGQRGSYTYGLNI